MKTVFGAAVAITLVLIQPLRAIDPKEANEVPWRGLAVVDKATRLYVGRTLKAAHDHMQRCDREAEGRYQKLSGYEAVMAKEKCGAAYEGLTAKLKADAIEELQGLIKDYPNTPEAKEAVELLKGLNKKP
jgi:hypothetical protein